MCEGEDEKFFLNKIDKDICVNPSKVVEKTGNLGATYLSGYVIVKIYGEAPDWVTKTRSHLKYFIDEDVLTNNPLITIQLKEGSSWNAIFYSIT